MKLLSKRPRPQWLPLVLACALAAPGGARAGQALYPYTVKPQDTLIGLGRTLLTDPAAWPEVARLSHLADANRIQPGQTLRIPLRLLRSAQTAATVIHVEGDVRIDGKPAQAADLIQPGQRLTTQGASSAIVALGDGSRIQLSPQTESVLAENRVFDLNPRKTAAAAPGGDGLFASTMQLVRGSLEVLASKVPRAKPLEVTTPTAVIGVRGTQYRVHHGTTAANTSQTEVLQGQVRADLVHNAAAGVDVGAGFGTALEPGAAPSVQTLPPAPDLSAVPQRFERPLVRFTVPGETSPLQVQVAADAQFDRLVRDERVAPGQQVRIAGLPDGLWHLRARRVDSRGIEGLDAHSQFTLKARPEPPAIIAPQEHAKQTVGETRFAWAENTEAARYRLQVARDAEFTQPERQIDAATGAQIHLELGAPGVYYWRMASVRATGDAGPWGDAKTFTLRSLPEAPQGGLSGDGQTLSLHWDGRAQDHHQAELAADAQFAQRLAQADLASPQWSLARPDKPGSYYFRYRSVEPDGYVSPWSDTLKIDVPRDWSQLPYFAPFLLLLAL